MTQFPLVDLVRQFTRDVQAVSASFPARMSEVGRDLLQRMPPDSEVDSSEGQAGEASSALPVAAEPSSLPAAAEPSTPAGKRSGSGAAAGKRMAAEPAAAAASIDTAQAAPRPQVGLLAASPRKGGGLLDAMRARGTFQNLGAGLSPLASRLPNAALVPLANVVAAKRERSSSESGQDKSFDGEPPPSPVGMGKSGAPPEVVRVPKRPRENSVLALYKEMVEPQLQIVSVTPLKGNTLASKFRRSSMLKQAAAREIRQSPTPAAALSPQPGLKYAKVAVTQASPSTASSAALPGRAAPALGMSPPASPASKSASATSGQEGAGKRLVKKTRPAVPAFSPGPKELKPWQLLRQTPLSPKHDEDNYEMSEKDENSDQEEEPDRSGKHVPRWCSTYLETLLAQSSWDPDTIFGSKVPTCDLDNIFSLDLYKKYSRERPKRRRGSSGQWSKDRLRAQEIRDYKRKMGQTKPYSATLKNKVASAAAGSEATPRGAASA